MNKSVTGGCLCGALRYEIAGDPIFAAHCHCRTCQKGSGGPMTTAVAFPESALRLSSGQPKCFTYTGDSRKPVERMFCGECGAMIYGKPALAKEMIFISAASLDDPSWVKPALHAYAASAQPWDPTNDDLPRFDKLPPQSPDTA
jgi:hypothetical protein